ncbi:MAG: chromosomal replication initiator protein DnaA, partial [Acidobacteriota bacterium]|nr:chromosomal replication initiator protein DnaA [Acidobacteriota bacterium]
SRTSFLRLEGGVLWANVPDEITKECMQQEYAGEVWWAIRDIGLPVSQVVYELGSSPVISRADEHRNTAPPARHPYFGEHHPEPEQKANEPVFAAASSLNPNFTFDSFVVGSCNQFAHAAAQAVATVPSKTYNPLFIYGGVGMGKTHLMHAIGRSLMDHYAGMKIVYTSSERFMNEMIRCIKMDRMQSFHRHYRSADVLLVDDIQTIAGKERTQEEFFHTFNELYEHQKQIVISGDSPPKNTPGLVERLRSRFEWGLMVDVQPPDLETKMAILDKKADAVDGFTLPEEVRIFIATKTKSNVRELEGALVKLIAYSSVTGTPVNLHMAQQVLKHLTHGQERKITIEAITKAVAEKFNLQATQVKQKSNERKIAYPRQIAMYIVKELTGASLPEIGRSFGGKHHTTVLHSIQKIDKLRQKDPDLDRLIHSVIESLH